MKSGGVKLIKDAITTSLRAALISAYRAGIQTCRQPAHTTVFRRHGPALEPITWLSFGAADPSDDMGLMAGRRIFRLCHLAPIIHVFVALARFLDPHWTVRSRINP
jgi:hypothetical protein